MRVRWNIANGIGLIDGRVGASVVPQAHDCEQPASQSASWPAGRRQSPPTPRSSTQEQFGTSDLHSFANHTLWARIDVASNPLAVSIRLLFPLLFLGRRCHLAPTLGLQRQPPPP
jgi:hypothetical protein